MNNIDHKPQKHATDLNSSTTPKPSISHLFTSLLIFTWRYTENLPFRISTFFRGVFQATMAVALTCSRCFLAVFTTMQLQRNAINVAWGAWQRLKAKAAMVVSIRVFDRWVPIRWLASYEISALKGIPLFVVVGFSFNLRCFIAKMPASVTLVISSLTAAWIFSLTNRIEDANPSFKVP